MSSLGSVAVLIERLEAGHHEAAQPLWEQYYPRLVRLARKKLRGTSRRVANEEDVALSAFDSFCRGVARGDFPDVSDRNSLWALLVTITARKAIDVVNHERRAKRGGGAVRGESALQGPDGRGDFDRVAGREPPPDFAAQVQGEFRRLLDLLGDAELEQVALWKLEGDGNAEIAARLGCVERTVERKVERIKALWAEEMKP